jgi:16S rRNA G966 N2-methylase RsmD
MINLSEHGKIYMHDNFNWFEKKIKRKTSSNTKKDLLFYPLESFKVNQLKVDEVSLYSTTDLQTSTAMCRWLKYNFPEHVDLHMTITDANACIGGSTIVFSTEFAKVNAVEIDGERFSMLEHNVKDVLRLSNVETYQGDYLEYIDKLKQDIIFLDLPWGGKDMKKHLWTYLYLSEKPVHDICIDLKNKSKLLILKVPKNFDFEFFLLKCFDIYEKYAIYNYSNNVIFIVLQMKETNINTTKTE